MVIEELKSWYNIDFELGEGVISGGAVNVWIGSALKRSKSLRASNLSENRTEKSMSGSVLSEAERLIEGAKSK